MTFIMSFQSRGGWTKGAKTAAFSIEPDLGISLDVTGHGDTPKARRLAIGLNKGTAIKVKDRSLIAHPYKGNPCKLAEDKEIPYQMEVLEYGGTDSELFI